MARKAGDCIYFEGVGPFIFAQHEIHAGEISTAEYPEAIYRGRLHLRNQISLDDRIEEESCLLIDVLGMVIVESGFGAYLYNRQRLVA